MFTHKILRVALIAAVMLLALNARPGSAEKLSFQPLPAPAADPVGMGSAFTYQGRLMSGSSPANGNYDFQFWLYDDATAGTLIGTFVPGDPFTTVTNGLFMLELDFGAAAFTGYERWLEIDVKPDGSSSFTTLTPRQKITPAPYATFAGTIYRKTVVVKPVTPAGSETDNGKELLIAMANITDASATNPYLLKIEPGIYDLFEDSLVMKPYVDVEGSGEGVTIIRANGHENLTATVVGASHVEIRLLTIEADGYPNGGPWYSTAIGVYVPDVVEFNLSHVTIRAYDSSYSVMGIINYGAYYTTPEGGYYVPAELTLDTVQVYSSFDDALIETGIIDLNGISNNNGSTLTLTHSEVVAGGTAYATGIYNDSSHAYIYDSSIVVKGDDFAQYYGIYDSGSADTSKNPTLYMKDSSVSAIGDNGKKDSILIGIRNFNTGLTQLFDSTIVAAGARTSATGIQGDGNTGGLFAMTNVKVEAFGTNTANIGIQYGDAPVVIRDSHVYAHDGSLAIGMDFSDTGAPDHTITQSEILVQGATPSGESDPNANSNIAVRITSEGLFKFIRDTIQVPAQDGGPAIGGVGLLNNGGGVIFENGTLNDMVMPAYMGMVHYYYGANTLTVNNSEIYTCSDPICISVVVFPVVPPGASPASLIGSSLIWGGPVVPPYSPVPPTFVQCVLVYDETWTSFGPNCP